MSKSKLTGGGIASRVVVKTGVRTGAATASKISPAAVSQIGISRGNHAETGTVKLKPQPLVTGQLNSVPLGNQVALNVNGGGPGKGRKTFPSGSQGSH